MSMTASDDGADPVLLQVERITNRLERAVVRGEDMGRLCASLLGPVAGRSMASTIADNLAGVWSQRQMPATRRRQQRA